MLAATLLDSPSMFEANLLKKIVRERAKDTKQKLIVTFLKIMPMNYGKYHFPQN